MNIQTLLKQIADHVANCKHELHAGNDFHAERHLVKLRELLNSKPELEAGGSKKEGSSCLIVKWHEISCDKCGNAQYFLGDARNSLSQFRDFGGIVTKAKKHYCNKLCFKKSKKGRQQNKQS